MRKIAFLLLMAILLTSTVSASSVTEDLATAKDNSSETPFAALSNAKAAVIIEPSSGRVLYELNSGEPMGMASTTKIMTALITLEQPNLDAEFEVDSEAIMVEGSSMGLKPGDIVTLRTLAWGMMMHSGNDAANEAAVAIAGDKSRFAEMMNQKAAEIGMTSTHFMNPSGLTEPEHYSTAYDMALLASEALKNPDFREMVSTKTVSVEYGNPPYKRLLLNHNRLLWRYPYAIGIKTGFTKAAGRCLVTAAEKDGVMLVCVTLNCYDDFTAHEEAYEEFFKKFIHVDFSDKAKNLTIPVTGGEIPSLNTSLAEPLEVSVMLEEEKLCRVEFEVPRFLYAPVTEGDVVGRAVVYLNDEIVAESEIIASSTIPAIESPKSFWSGIFGG